MPETKIEFPCHEFYVAEKTNKRIGYCEFVECFQIAICVSHIFLAPKTQPILPNRLTRNVLIEQGVEKVDRYGSCSKTFTFYASQTVLTFIHQLRVGGRRNIPQVFARRCGLFLITFPVTRSRIIIH